MVKNIILLLGLMILAMPAQAGILSRFFDSFNTYPSYYYPQPTVRYYNNSYIPYNQAYHTTTRYYPNQYYNNYNNNYYNRHNSYYNRYNRYHQPVIRHRSNIIRKTSSNNDGIVNVSARLDGLTKLEKRYLGESFSGDSDLTRIERLEQKMFGAIQQGSLEERFDVLRHLAKVNPSKYQNNYYSNDGYYAHNYTPPIFTGGSGMGWQNALLGNFKNQFIGMPTGFTPAMDPAYMDYFEAERATSGAGQSIDYRTNTGYFKSNTDRSSGMGVTILD